MNSFIFSSLFFLSFLSSGACYPSDLPYRTLAGVTVVDTPIVRDAISFAQGYEDNSVFNHSMRSWIFGSVIVNKNPAYTNTIDKEVHAAASILHDVGFGEKVLPGSEIDPAHAANGGNGVRKFLANNAQGKLWTASRVQLLVDAVTLHLEDSDSTRAPEIRAVRDGQQVDLAGGPLGYVTAAEYTSVVAAYPLGDLKAHLAAEGHGQTSSSHAMPPSSGHQMMSPDSKAHGHTL